MYMVTLVTPFIIPPTHYMVLVISRFNVWNVLTPEDLVAVVRTLSWYLNALVVLDDVWS